jgi:endonuclease/exonuclease/phosphatase family metal-dependent hydrolase
VLATFPSLLPVLRLDRIYVRGFKITKAAGAPRQALVAALDHLALSAELERA